MDREVEQVLLNVRGMAGGIVGTALMSAHLSFRAMTFLMRLAKKGLVAVGAAERLGTFIKATDGKYTVYNIPMTGERVGKIRQLNRLELELEKTKNPITKRSLRKQIKNIQKSIPELGQLEKLGVGYCVLPKLNGSDQTIQVAIAKKDDQPFKTWFLNHLTTHLSGGEKEIGDIQVMTEGNYTILNLPFEGNQLAEALEDFDKLGINYACLSDLNAGDGNSQVIVPNADQDKVEAWFKIWKESRLHKGEEPGEMYEMDPESYMNTGYMKELVYIETSDQKYREADAEFEEKAEMVPWTAPLGQMDSEQCIHYIQDNNYVMVHLGREVQTESDWMAGIADQMRKEGYFLVRIPGTHGEGQEILIIPTEQVFHDRDGFVAFFSKSQKVMVADTDGNVTQKESREIVVLYGRMEQAREKLEELKQTAIVTTTVKEVAKQCPAVTPKLPKL